MDNPETLATRIHKTHDEDIHKEKNPHTTQKATTINNTNPSKNWG